MAGSHNKKKLDDLFLAFEEICQISAWYWGCTRAGTRDGYFSHGGSTTATTIPTETVRDQHMRWARIMINKLRGWEVKPIGSLHMALVKHPLLIEESGSSAWRPMTDPPPKDKPILVWHDDEGDPWDVDGVSTSFGFWAENYATLAVGAYVAKWVEGGDDGPDWWFVNDGDDSTPVSPVLWKPIDVPKYNPYDNAKRIVKECTEPMKITIVDAARPIEEQDQLGKDEPNDCPF